MIRLRERMEKVGFISTDRPHQIVREAELAMRHL